MIAPGGSATRARIGPLAATTARTAFTLVELVVVIAIIAIIAALATPAIGPMLSSNQLAEATNTLNGLLVTAQTAAEVSLTPVALRIERAYQTIDKIVPGDTSGDKYLQMDKNILTDQAKWLPHQQARMVMFATPRPGATSIAEGLAFSQIPGSKVIKLPEAAWLAPSYALEMTGPNTPRMLLDDNSLTYQPRELSTGFPVNSDASPFNRLDTFYLVFSRQGGVEVFQSTPSDPSTHYWYLDEMQPYWDTKVPPSRVNFALVNHPDSSARAVLVYDRRRFEDLGSVDGARRQYLRNARSIVVSRSIASGVEGRSQ